MKSKKQIRRKLDKMWIKWYTLDIKNQQEMVIEYSAYMAALEWVIRS